MTDWQPIETAPRDGTRVLVWAHDRAWTADRCSEGVPDFWDSDGTFIQPTHWQPLPAPPVLP